MNQYILKAAEESEAERGEALRVVARRIGLFELRFEAADEGVLVL